MRNNLCDKQAKLSNWLQSFYHIDEFEVLYSVSLINRTTRSFALSQEVEAFLVQRKKLNSVLSYSHALLSGFSDNCDTICRLCQEG